MKWQATSLLQRGNGLEDGTAQMRRKHYNVSGSAKLVTAKNDTIVMQSTGT